MANSEGLRDLVRLANELRSERLLIGSELECLRELNSRVERGGSELVRAAWTSGRRRCFARQLFAQGDPRSSGCCRRTRDGDGDEGFAPPVFVEAHKALRYQDALAVSSLLGRVRASPGVASLWLCAAEASGPAAVAEVARALSGGLYAGDVRPMRRLLRHLARHRLANAEDPRRTVCQGQSGFTRLYGELVEGFRPARLFLAAALKLPMLPLLQIDVCLIIDPDKVMERIKRNSSSPDQDWQEQLIEYRNWTINTLVALVEKFIESLRNIWNCFPPTVAWIVRQTASALQSSGRTSDEDIHSICTTLVFTNFICQAIINPDAYGITDVPITNVSRFNLGQVALTLQTLCLMKHQEIDGKFRDLYSKFERGCIFSLLDVLIENPSYSVVPDRSAGSDGSENCDPGDDSMSENNEGECEEKDIIKIEPSINPNIALFTRNDLQLLVTLLKKVPLTSIGDCGSRQKSQSKLDNMTTDGGLNGSSFTVNKIESEDPNKEKFPIELENVESGDSACGVSDSKKIDFEADSPVNEEFYHLLKDINPETISKLQKLLQKLPDSNFTKENFPIPADISTSTSFKGKAINNIQMKLGSKKSKELPRQNLEVLVIKLPGDNVCEPIGMVAESKVLECHYSTMASRHALSQDIMQHDVELSDEKLKLPEQDTKISGRSILNNAVEVEANSQVSQEKRTRFSLSHDEGSIGNTSDNLEAVSEAASNHSVTSSLEMETEDQNDNLSDMVSANVSGRGSPNISGRDTPSSQVTEGEQNPQPTRQSTSSQSIINPSKQAKLFKRTRHDIEDKFCKFEIKKVIEGDETFSILSDTWSTDVLASDSETIAETNYDRTFIAPILTLSQQSVSVGSISNSVAPSVAPSQPDVSETASESAWSTDALVSDSDRMTEVDMDDCNSVTRSEADVPRFELNPVPPNIVALHNSFPVEREAPNELSNGSCATEASTSGVYNGLGIDLTNAIANENITLNSPDSVGNLLHRASNKTPDKPRNDQSNTINTSLERVLCNINQNFVNGLVSSNISDSNIEDDFAQKLTLSNHSTFKSTENSNIVNSNTDGIDSSFNGGRLNESCNFNTEKPSSSVNLNSDKYTPIQIVNNGTATSRWLNDPSQKFPKQVDHNQYFSIKEYSAYQMDNIPKEEIGNICQNIENIALTKPDCLFRPIKPDENMADNSFEIHLNDSLSVANNVEKFSLNPQVQSLSFDEKSRRLTTINNSAESMVFKINHAAHSKTHGVNDIKMKNATNASKSSKTTNKASETLNESPLNEVTSSGSAISLSNLSVNSIDTTTSDKSSSQDVNSENLTERRVTPPNNQCSVEVKTNGMDGANTLPRQSATFYTNITKPGPSTGAIPKSISFDATAEKSHRYSGRRTNDESNEVIGINFGDLKNNVKRSGGNFLNKIKLFRNKSRGGASGNYGKRSSNGENNEDTSKTPIEASIDNDTNKPPSTKSSSELSEDILAKYRRKASTSSEAAASDSTSHSGSGQEKNRDIVGNETAVSIDPTPDKHSGNNEFETLRKELRLILSTIDMNSIELSLNHSSSLALTCALRLEGAWDGPVALRALGALEAIDSSQGSLLLKALRADSAARRPYINYLSRCRKSLLSTIATIESEYSWQMSEVKRQGSLAIATRARSSLSAKEPRLIALQERLRTGLADERRDALAAALQNLFTEIASEDSWTGANEWELEQANLTIERVVFGRVYRQAMFPNGDGDVMRDQLLRDHIVKLWNNIDFPLPRLRNIPLVSAERIISYLSVYKAPRDKVDCVVCFVKSLINLLNLSSDGAPGADELTPVLVYILIKVNPLSLLSTVQFVNTFIEPPLEGEQLYCWTQFCAAIEYIKTLD